MAESPSKQQYNNLRIQRILTRGAQKYVAAAVQNLTMHSRFLGSDDSSVDSQGKPIALMDRDEIRATALLGCGSFAEVRQIQEFQFLHCFEPVQEHLRDRLQEQVMDRNGRYRYAVKHLRRDLVANSPKTFLHAAVHLLVEAKYLTKMEHPNIIKIRGWSGENAKFDVTRPDGFFLILDRLDETLKQRIARWSIAEQARLQNETMTDLTVSLREKTGYARQIACALDYMHDRNIIYRDLKPDNIGFKGDTIQLFDFGMARELPKDNPDQDETFRMSGVGTRRYMAPEAYLGEKYNLKADVYSWTMVYFAMLSLNKPFEEYDTATHKLFVCKQGERPTVSPAWPDSIQELCIEGWAASHRDRPTMKEVYMRLKKIENTLANTSEASFRSSILKSLLDDMDAFSGNIMA